MKSEGLAQLRELALQHSRWKHPMLPESAMYVKPYTDKTANGLTRAIIDYVRFNGYQAERINCTGKMVDNTIVMTDVLGDRRTIGSVKWLPTSGQRGTADVSAVIRSRAVKIEVKMKDRQSPDQVEYQRQVEQSGGVYWICRSFDEFLRFYNELK
jgi:ribulose kinase